MHRCKRHPINSELLERCGSQSGRPRADITIEKSGEIKDEE